jgi:purine nucleosidase
MKKPNQLFNFILVIVLALTGCTSGPSGNTGADQRIPVIFDTDANNELDDQHALAYLLLSDKTFQTLGVTANATWSGGPIAAHVKEAERIVQLCGLKGRVPVLAGADGSFPEIADHLAEPEFDGHEAVEFIIREALKARNAPLVVIAVGKLTNVALALKKEPAVAEKIRLVWLGSNYPGPGEYNLENDTASMNYLLCTEVPFEIATVRYGDSTGTAFVTVTQQEVNQRMPGLGPHVEEPVTGRHGGTFNNFGDYSVSLFGHIEYPDERRSRSLFDMAAVAIVKDPAWAEPRQIHCPVYRAGQWVEQPQNPRMITLWENFNKEKILADFYATLEKNRP